MLISPSLLSADFSRLKDEVQAIELAGADWLHLDIMDGNFVPNLTFGAGVVKSLRKHTSLLFDVHLMVNNPALYIDAFVDAGAGIITIHQEAETHINRTINYIKNKGVKAGISLNPATPVSLLEDIMADVDLLLIMSVNPGFPAQKLIEGSYTKIKKAKTMAEALNKNLIIEVDGGVNAETAGHLKNSGANALVAGNYIFNSEDYKDKINILKNL